MKIKIPYYSKTSYVIVGCFIFFTACKTKQTTSTTNANESTNAIKTEGIVSHKYKSQGCSTIIICAAANTDTLFLIPTPPLQNFNTDGLKISFTYHTLRVHNPKGCHQGIPAEILNIKKQ